jgi:hypothetical protein
MTISFFIQVFVNGLMLGLTYVLIASGFSLIYGIMRLLNFAHGEFYMLGVFATYLLCERLGVNYFIALVLSMVIIAVLGILVYRFFFRPFRDQHDPSPVRREKPHDPWRDDPAEESTGQPVRFPSPAADLLVRDIETPGGESSQRVQDHSEKRVRVHGVSIIPRTISPRAAEVNRKGSNLHFPDLRLFSDISQQCSFESHPCISDGRSEDFAPCRSLP